MYQLVIGPRKFPAVFEVRSKQRSEVARREWELCEKNLNVILPASKAWKEESLGRESTEIFSSRPP